MNDILDGVKAVVFDIGSGMAESCKRVFTESYEFYNDVNVKLMGSYEEIGSYEKDKEAKQ